MKIHILLFNWRGQYEKVLEKLNSFKAIKLLDNNYNNIKITVINSDDEYRRKNDTYPSKDLYDWIDIGEEAYFGDQFAKAVEVFEGDIMMHVQGDCSYNLWNGMIQDALRYHKKYKWGIYAPNVDYTWYNSERADIDALNNHQSSKFQEENLKWVSSPDCTCWFIDKEIIESYKASGFDMGKYKHGWGWDLLFPLFSYLLGHPVIRDYSHTVDHPISTNYDKSEGEREMAQMFDNLEDFNSDLGQTIKMLKYNKEEWGNDMLWWQEVRRGT